MGSLVKIEQLTVGGFDDNFSYLGVADNGGAFIVDPTGDAEIIRQAVARAGKINPRYILLTHRHRDHFAALGEVREFFPAPIMEFAYLKDHQVLPLDGAGIEAIFTPGHTPDSVCYRLTDDSAIFTGDTVFVGYIGFCDARTMYHSLYHVLDKVPDSCVVYSGHNYGEKPSDTLGHQREVNPYLRCRSYDAFLEQLKYLD